MARKQKQARVKIVKVRYGLGGRPHEKNIEKAMARMMAQGYRLEQQHEEKAGCLAPPQAGYTRLMFVLEE